MEAYPQSPSLRIDTHVICNWVCYLHDVDIGGITSAALSTSLKINGTTKLFSDCMYLKNTRWERGIKLQGEFIVIKGVTEIAKRHREGVGGYLVHRMPP